MFLKDMYLHCTVSHSLDHQWQRSYCWYWDDLHFPWNTIDFSALFLCCEYLISGKCWLPCSFIQSVFTFVYSDQLLTIIFWLVPKLFSIIYSTCTDASKWLNRYKQSLHPATHQCGSYCCLVTSWFKTCQYSHSCRVQHRLKHIIFWGGGCKLPLKLTYPVGTFTCPATLFNKGEITCRAGQVRVLFSLPHCCFLSNSLATGQVVMLHAVMVLAWI